MNIGNDWKALILFRQFEVKKHKAYEKHEACTFQNGSYICKNQYGNKSSYTIVPSSFVTLAK